MADKKQTMLYGLLTSIASKITYDNTESGLTADNVQDAIDELNSNSYKKVLLADISTSVADYTTISVDDLKNYKEIVVYGWASIPQGTKVFANVSCPIELFKICTNGIFASYSYSDMQNETIMITYISDTEFQYRKWSIGTSVDAIGAKIYGVPK